MQVLYASLLECMMQVLWINLLHWILYCVFTAIIYCLRIFIPISKWSRKVFTECIFKNFSTDLHILLDFQSFNLLNFLNELFIWSLSHLQYLFFFVLSSWNTQNVLQWLTSLYIFVVVYFGFVWSWWIFLLLLLLLVLLDF